jgi:hypothetical protein
MVQSLMVKNLVRLYFEVRLGQDSVGILSHIETLGFGPYLRLCSFLTLHTVEITGFKIIKMSLNFSCGLRVEI